MIKVTIILIIIHALLVWLTNSYVNSLSLVEKFAFSQKRYSKRMTIWLIILGLMKLICVICLVVSAIMLVIKWL